MPTDSQLRKARGDLLAFSKLVRTPLAPWQAEALRLERRTTVIVAPRQVGKSRSLAVLGLWWAFRKRGQRVLIVSAGEEASRRLLGEVRRIVAGSGLLAGSVTDELAAVVTLSNGSEIRSVPASERQIRGWSVDLLLVDEAAQVDDELLFGAALPTTAARAEARIVLAGSPAAAEGAFFVFSEQGESGSEHVETFRWRLGDAAWISGAVVDAARAQLVPALFEREYEGRFADVDADERVIDRRWIEAAQERSIEARGRMAYGLDVARMGTDSSVLAVACGGVVRLSWSVHGADLMAVVARTGASVDEAPGPVWVDATGVGAGVLDRLRELGFNAKEFVAAARARRPDRFANLKAESWWHVREQFRDGLIDLDPEDRVLAGQLASVRYSLTSGGKIEIVSKRATTGPSPDRADALVIALWGARGADVATISWARGQLPDTRPGGTRGLGPAAQRAHQMSLGRGGSGFSPSISAQTRHLSSVHRRLLKKSLQRPQPPKEK